MAAKKAAAKRGAKKKAAARKPAAKRGAKKKAPARKPTAKKRTAAARSAASAPASQPARNRGLLAGAAVLAVLAAIALAVVLIDSGDGGSGGASDAAGPALTEVDTAMQDVFDTFHQSSLRRFDAAQTPYGKFQDEVLGPRSAMLESYDAERRDYAQAMSAIHAAQAVLKENEADLTDAGDASDDAECYVADSRAFLDRYEADVAYLGNGLALDRRIEEGYSATGAGIDLTAIRAEVEQEVARLEGIAREYAALETPPELEQLGAALETLNGLQVRQQKQLLGFIDSLDSGSGTISRADIRIDAAAAVRRVQAAYAALQERSELSRSIAALMEQADQLAGELES
jgi:hypothetical protein